MPRAEHPRLGRRPQAESSVGGYSGLQSNGKDADSGVFKPYELPILDAHAYQPDRASTTPTARAARSATRSASLLPGPGAEQPGLRRLRPARLARPDDRCSTTTTASASFATPASRRASPRPGGTADEARAQHSRLPNWVIGLVLVIVIAIGRYLRVHQAAAVERRPTRSRPCSARRRTCARTRRCGSRASNVGKVTRSSTSTSADDAELRAQTGDEPARRPSDQPPGEQAAVVTMELNEDALPLHEDATFKLRPRLFLEGNYFVDVQPGSPNAPEIAEDHTFPVNQTVLLGAARPGADHAPGRRPHRPADLPRPVRQRAGQARRRRGLPRALPHLGAGRKFTSQVNEAVLGTRARTTSPALISGLDRVVRGLGRNEGALQDLVTNLRIFSGSFAAEDAALGQAIEELPDTLEAARPGVREPQRRLPAAARVRPRGAARRRARRPRRSTRRPRSSTRCAPLVSERELRGLVADLRPTIPRARELAHRTIPFLEQARALSSCFNEVVIPWSNDTVDPVAPATVPARAVGRVFEETAYGLTGIAGESRSGDANGQYIRVAGRRRREHGQDPDAIPSLTGGGLQDAVGVLPVPDPRRDAARSTTRRRPRSSRTSRASARSRRTSPPASAQRAAPTAPAPRRRAARRGAASLRLASSSTAGDRSEGARGRLEARRRAAAAKQLADARATAGGGD